LSPPDSSSPLSRLGRQSATALGLVAVLVALLVLGLTAGAVPTWPDARAGNLIAAVLAVAALVLLVVLRRSVDAVAARARDAAALDAVDIGIALYDAEDRLIHCNLAFRELFPEIAERLLPGANYADLMRAYYPLAAAEVIAGRAIEEFVDERRQGRGRSISEVVRRHAGGWLLMTDARTADGGTLSFRMQIAEPRVVDLELRQRRRAVDDLSELTGDWFWQTDADGRFVEFSAAMERSCGIASARALGLRREELPGYDCEPAERERYEAAVSAREPFSQFRYRCTNDAGAAIWVAVSGRPIFDGDGRFVGYYGTGREVTERESTIAGLRRSRETLRALTELATEWYWETDAGLTMIEVRGPAPAAPGLEARLRGRRLPDLLRHPDYRFDVAAIERAIDAQAAFRRERFAVRRGDGAIGYFEVSGQPKFDQGRFAGYRGLVWDVTERESLLARVSESEARFRALTALSSDWYWEMDAQLRIASVQSGGAAGAVAADAMIGRALWEAEFEAAQPASWDEIRALLDRQQSFRDLLLRCRPGGGGPAQSLLLSGDPVRDADGRFAGFRGLARDISDQVRAQERVERLAKVDPLTRLANRQSFDERAQKMLDAALAEGRQCALLFVDLDNFRLLNNGYGHRVGDRVLALVAGRMRAVVDEPDLLGRRGGDELVVLLGDVPRSEFAVEVAQRLIQSISEPERVLGMEVSVTPSIGIAFFPADGADLDALLNAADAAMYQAKEAGRKTYAFYTPAVARRVDLRLRLEQRLRRALESRDFRLFYQPLVSLADGKPIGAEALIRWKDAELGDISPAEFIPIAEESGLIIGLGDWVIREACRARRVWRGLGLDLPPISINFSKVELRQIGCVERFLDALAEHEVHPGDIEIEVTETGLLDISTVARENLIRLRNAGVKIALDDFGIGYSSLSHLRDLPISRLKIDRSFTVECMKDARVLTIVKAVIDMSRSLGIAVTAEGIETPAQQTWMQHLGCDSAQGFLFSRPIPADDFLKLFLDKRGSARERSLMH
jgi:diguanylate cyclase (GGDEF)-like protein/PAS domain S-box-containing protein